MDLFSIKTLYPKPPKDIDLYLLVAYWAVGGWWKVITTCKKYEEAEIKAGQLPKGYSERKIFHLTEERKI